METLQLEYVFIFIFRFPFSILSVFLFFFPDFLHHLAFAVTMKFRAVLIFAKPGICPGICHIIKYNKCLVKRLGCKRNQENAYSYCLQHNWASKLRQILQKLKLYKKHPIGKMYYLFYRPSALMSEASITFVDKLPADTFIIASASARKLETLFGLTSFMTGISHPNHL